MSAASFWQELGSDWFVLDCELMPWSLKARELLTRQYAAVGAASGALLAQAHQLLAAAGARGIDIGELSASYAERQQDAQRLVAGRLPAAIAGRCPLVNDLRLAPFHLLASENRVYSDQTHLWQMSQLHRLAAADTALLLGNGLLRLHPAEFPGSSMKTQLPKCDRLWSASPSCLTKVSKSERTAGALSLLVITALPFLRYIYDHALTVL